MACLTADADKLSAPYCRIFALLDELSLGTIDRIGAASDAEVGGAFVS